MLKFFRNLLKSKFDREFPQYKLVKDYGVYGYATLTVYHRETGMIVDRLVYSSFEPMEYDMAIKEIKQRLRGENV